MKDTVDDFSPLDPAAALARAEEARSAVRAGSGWTTWYLGAFAATSAVFLSLTAWGGVAVYASSWVVYGVIASWFARRERVSWRGFDRLASRCLLSWLVLQCGVGALGFNVFSNDALYWVPAAGMVAAPLLVGAWRSAHR